MAAALGSLTVSLSANTVEFTKGMDKAAYQTEKAMREMRQQAKMVGAAMGVMAGVAVGAMAVMVKRAIDSADDLAKMSQKTGLAVEQLSQLQHAAGLSGVENEALEKSIRLLNISIGEGLAGDKLRIAAFKSLGITQADLGKGTQEVMMKMADAYSKAKDGAGKVAAGNVLMGKSSTDMIPLLNGGRVAIMELMTEADKLGLTISTDFAKSAEEFNDNLSRIETLSSRLAISLGSDLVNGLGKAMKAMADAVIAGGALSGVIAGIQTLLTGDDRHKNNVALVEDTDELLKAENRLSAARASGMDPRGIAAREKHVKDLKERINLTMGYRKLLDEEDAKVASIAKAAQDTKTRTGEIVYSKGDTPTKKGGKGKSAAKDLDADFKRYMDNLQGQIDKTQELSAVETLLLDIRRGGLTVSPAQQQQLTDIAQIIDSEKELVIVMNMKREAAMAASDAVIQSNQEYQSLLSRLLEATPSANLEKQRSDVGLLTAEFEAGRLSESLYLEAVSTRLDITAEKIDKSKSAAEELGMTFTSAFEDAIVGGKAFSDVLDGLI
ncbi:MAG: hypothetical protein JJD98_12190, partial [Polaromonas sp.]|nr:hypothetical protein [Polaromonas sp.]